MNFYWSTNIAIRKKITIAICPVGSIVISFSIISPTTEGALCFFLWAIKKQTNKQTLQSRGLPWRQILSQLHALIIFVPLVKLGGYSFQTAPFFSIVVPSFFSHSRMIIYLPFMMIFFLSKSYIFLFYFLFFIFF